MEKRLARVGRFRRSNECGRPRERSGATRVILVILVIALGLTFLCSLVDAAAKMVREVESRSDLGGRLSPSACARLKRWIVVRTDLEQ